MLFVSASTALLEPFADQADCFPWMAGTMLAFECCEVIGLRLTKLAAGDETDGEDEEEAQLVISVGVVIARIEATKQSRLFPR